MSEAKETVHVVDMSNAQWAKLFKASRLLHSWRGRGTPEIPLVERAQKCALSLKVAPEGACFDDYEVQDDSFFTTLTTKTLVESELTLKGFTESGIHAALAAGAQGFTGGASTDITWARQSTTSTSQKSEITRIHCYYNCPRVKVRLNNDSWKFSDDLKSFAKNQIAQAPQAFQTGQACEVDQIGLDKSLESFFYQFGCMIARTVWLGGQLYSFEKVESSQTQKIQDTEKNLKVAISANFRAPFIGVDAGGHHSKGQGRVVKVGKSGESHEFIVHTQGGNSFLAESSIEWAKSLGPYQTWRVIQQEDLVEVLPFLIEVGSTESSLTGDEAKCLNYLKTLNGEWNKKKLWQEQNPPAPPEEPREQPFNIKLGNTWSFLRHDGFRNRNWYQWTFYVEPSRPEIVDQVKIHLDPRYFKRPDITRKQPPFESTADGWGPVNITATVVMKHGWDIKQEDGTLSGKRIFNYTLEWPTETTRRENVHEKSQNKLVEIHKG